MANENLAIEQNTTIHVVYDSIKQECYTLRPSGTKYVWQSVNPNGDNFVLLGRSNKVIRKWKTRKTAIEHAINAQENNGHITVFALNSYDGFLAFVSGISIYTLTFARHMETRLRNNDEKWGDWNNYAIPDNLGKIMFTQWNKHQRAINEHIENKSWDDAMRDAIDSANYRLFVFYALMKSKEQTPSEVGTEEPQTEETEPPSE